MNYSDITCARCGKGHEDHIDSFVDSDDESWDGCDFVTPEAAYELKHYPAHETPIGMSRAVTYISAEGSAWSFEIGGRGEGDALVLLLGDMGYHQISREELTLYTARETAEAYDETGAADDIEQIVLAAQRLLK